MKKTLKVLLSVLLAVLMCAALIACDKDDNAEETKTGMTIELISKDSDDALVDAEALDEGEEHYYAITGYSFSDEDAKIVANVKKDKFYYTDFYTGPENEDYEAQKARYAQLKDVVLPSEVRIPVVENKLSITDEQLEASRTKGYIDLTEGSADYKTVKIRALGASALLNHTEIETLVIPESYLYVGSGALGGCSALKSLTVPFVGQKAGALNGAKVFGYVFGTVEYTGGTSVTQNYNSSGTATYYLPTSLTEVKVTKELLPEYAFHNASTVKSVEYLATTEIPAYAFYGCSALENIAIASTVKTIGEGAFSGCTGLLEVALPDGLEKIGNSAFNGCSSLYIKDKKLTVPASVTYIGENAFAGCTAVEELEITSVTVKAGAFSGMTALKKATLNSADMSIGVFASWSDMLDVTLNGCTVLGGSADVKLAFIGAFEADDGLQKANIKYTIA